MRQYFLRRLLLLPLTLLGITFVAFVITRFVPGGPLDQALAEKQQAAAKSRGISAGNSSSLSPQEELLLKRFYKLDRPLLAGYVEWLGAWPAPVQQQIVEVAGGQWPVVSGQWSVAGGQGRGQGSAVAGGAGGGEIERKVTLVFSATVRTAKGARRQENLRLPAVLRGKRATGAGSAGGGTGGGVEKFAWSVEPDAAGARDAVAAFAKKHNLTDAEADALFNAAAGNAWTARQLETPPAAPVAASSPSAAPAAPAAAPLQVDVFQRRFDGILQGNFGRSFLRGEPVLDVIVSKLPVSLWFGGWSLVLTYGVCIPLGILKALRHKTPLDNLTSVALFTGYALPGYILAVILLYVFAFRLQLFPHSGFADPDLPANAPPLTVLGDRLRHTFLPLLCLTSGSFALMTMLMKNTLLDNLALDYVRTAVAKGVTFRDAVLKHAFRNSLVPIATSFGNCLGALLTGSFLIEKIFDIDGIGLLGFSSLVGRDYPVFLGLLTCSSLLLLLGNILSDLCVAAVDPRIRFGE